MTSNYERWIYYLQEFGSPKIFKDWGFYSMISATLQRRVYAGTERLPLFPNMFVLLTAPAGIGKGMILGEIERIFRHPRMKKVAGIEETRQAAIDEVARLAGGQGQELRATAKRDSANIALKNMLIPLSPNATTFEGMCDILAQSTSPLRIVNPDGTTRPGMHSSLCVHLEELGSLFRRNTEDINTLLCQLYDCKDPYQYRPKSAELAEIRYPCVSILAGATPDMIRRTFSNAILNEGFASRTVFAYAPDWSFPKYDTPTWTEDQLKEHAKIADHVLALAKIQGPVSFTPEAHEFSRSTFEREDFQAARINKNPKLDAYYRRRNITHKKLSMAVHYADHLTNIIGVESCITAHKLLERTEETMHLALASDAKNPLAPAVEIVAKHIRREGEATKKQLLTQYFDDLPGDPYESIETVLKVLIDSGKIKENGKPNTYLWITT